MADSNRAYFQFYRLNRFLKGQMCLLNIEEESKVQVGYNNTEEGSQSNDLVEVYKGIQ